MVTQENVFENIYNIAQSNLEKSGGSMAFTKDAFLYSTRQDLKNINVFDMAPYDNETFLQVLYVAFFFRTPEENARLNWGKLNNMPKKEFQKKCFQTLVSSQEYLKNGTIVYNNIYTPTAPKANIIITPSTVSNPYIERLYKYYRKLPLAIKNIIKRLLGGNK